MDNSNDNFRWDNDDRQPRNDDGSLEYYQRRSRPKTFDDYRRGVEQRERNNPSRRTTENISGRSGGGWFSMFSSKKTTTKNDVPPNSDLIVNNDDFNVVNGPLPTYDDNDKGWEYQEG
jgi:hypothetical protein